MDLHWCSFLRKLSSCSKALCRSALKCNEPREKHRDRIIFEVKLLLVACRQHYRGSRTLPSNMTTQSNIKPEHPGTRSLTPEMPKDKWTLTYHPLRMQGPYLHNLQVYCTVKEITFSGYYMGVCSAYLMVHCQLRRCKGLLQTYHCHRNNKYDKKNVWSG